MSDELGPKVYSKLTEIIKKIFNDWIKLKDKIEKSLEELNICVCDLKTSLDSIICIRNKLIHGHGKEFYEIDINTRLQASRDLLAILDRMVLAKLNYDGCFNDFHNEDGPRRRLMSEIRGNRQTNESA